MLTNDDGIDAPGLAALRAACLGLATPLVVAPEGPWSSRSHAITTDGPIAVRRRSDDQLGIEGTPADCVRLGLHHLVSDVAWVLSGINSGGNLGADLHHSGTAAAAREAVLHGRPAIALSHYVARGRTIDWDRAAEWSRRVLKLLTVREWTPGTFWNVNLPHPGPEAAEPAIVFCPVDPSPLPLRFELEGDFARYRGDYQGRARRAGGDVDVCFGGAISVSRVPVFPPWHEVEHLA
jgi:5'-nucleotidase